MNREQFRQLRQDLRTRRWVDLIIALGLGPIPAVMMLAALLDLLDRNLPGATNGPVGRGYLLAAKGLTRWIAVIVDEQRQRQLSSSTSPRETTSLLPRPAVFVDPIVADGVDILAQALSADGYREIAQQTTRPDTQGFITVLAVLSLSDPDGVRLSATWSPLQHETWDAFCVAICRGLSYEFKHLLDLYANGERLTAAHLGDCVHAVIKFRAMWDRFPPDDYGWLPRSRKEMGTLQPRWRTFAEKHALPDWQSRLARLLYARKRDFANTQRLSGDRTKEADIGNPAAIPVPADGTPQQKRVSEGGRKVRLVRTRVAPPTGGAVSAGASTIPTGGAVGTALIGPVSVSDDAEGLIGAPIEEQGGRPRPADGCPRDVPFPIDPSRVPLSLPPFASALPERHEALDFRMAPANLSGRTIDLPLLSDHGNLPGQMLSILVGSLLVSDRFVDAPRNEQTFFLLAMLAIGQGLPIDRGVGLCTCAGEPTTDERGPSSAIDLADGRLWCRVEDALRSELAQSPLRDVPSEPVTGGYWALTLVAPMGGLLSIFTSQVRCYRDNAAAPLMWVTTAGGGPRPVSVTDVMRWLAHWSPALTHPAEIGDFSRLCETLTWLSGTRACPAILPLLTGTSIERQGVPSAYHAPLLSTRTRMSTSIWAAAIDQIHRRLLDLDPLKAGRFLDWLAEGAAHAPVPVPTNAATTRVGTPRCQTLASIAAAYVASCRAFHGAMRNVAAPETGHVLERHAALTMRVIGGYRIEDLGRLDLRLTSDLVLRRRLSGDATAPIADLVIPMKAKGDAQLRPTRVILPDPCDEALTAYLDWATTEGKNGPLFSAAVLAELRLLLPGARHALSTTLLDHYDELFWTPSDYRLWQGMFGHASIGFPLGTDGDCTSAQARRVAHTATAVYLRHLLAAAIVVN